MEKEIKTLEWNHRTIRIVLAIAFAVFCFTPFVLKTRLVSILSGFVLGAITAFLVYDLRQVIKITPIIFRNTLRFLLNLISLSPKIIQIIKITLFATKITIITTFCASFVPLLFFFITQKYSLLSFNPALLKNIICIIIN